MTADEAEQAAGGRTGNPRVDAAMDELDRVSGLAPPEQIAVFTAVHRELQETLTALDEER